MSDLFPEQFLTHVFDDLITYWGICLISFLFDGVFRKAKTDTKFPVAIPDVVKLVLFNQFFVTFPVFYYFSEETPDGSLCDVENLYKIPLLIFLYEVLFFYTHKILHMFFYESIHKIHHRWIRPISVSAFYAHPIDHLFSVILPVILAAKWSRLNYTTLRCWHIYALSNTLISAHGGYMFNENHAIHHATIHYNFGAIGLLDWLHGTYKMKNK